jgi:hypothetical protein
MQHCVVTDTSSSTAKSPFLLRAFAAGPPSRAECAVRFGEQRCSPASMATGLSHVCTLNKLVTCTCQRPMAAVECLCAVSGRLLGPWLKGLKKLLFWPRPPPPPEHTHTRTYAHNAAETGVRALLLLLVPPPPHTHTPHVCRMQTSAPPGVRSVSWMLQAGACWVRG